VLLLIVVMIMIMIWYHFKVVELIKTLGKLSRHTVI